MKWRLSVTISVIAMVISCLNLAFLISARAQVPQGYRVRAQISACTSNGCQSQTWFLRNTAWCGKTADGWSPTQGTGKLSVTCHRPI
jgi:hypothetical protein